MVAGALAFAGVQPNSEVEAQPAVLALAVRCGGRPGPIVPARVRLPTVLGWLATLSKRAISRGCGCAAGQLVLPARD